jgi:hypothetical protein
LTKNAVQEFHLWRLAKSNPDDLKINPWADLLTFTANLFWEAVPFTGKTVRILNSRTNVCLFQISPVAAIKAKCTTSSDKYTFYISTVRRFGIFLHAPFTLDAYVLYSRVTGYNDLDLLLETIDAKFHSKFLFKRLFCFLERFRFCISLASKVGKKCSYSFFKNSEKFQKAAFYAAFKIAGK